MIFIHLGHTTIDYLSLVNTSCIPSLYIPKFVVCIVRMVSVTSQISDYRSDRSENPSHIIQKYRILHNTGNVPELFIKYASDFCFLSAMSAV